MDVTPTSLWIQTGLALAGAVAGVMLHLKWHPLRRELSEAWDIMTGMPWLTVLGAALMLMAGTVPACSAESSTCAAGC